MALPVPPDRDRGLHRGQVVSDPQVHRGSLRAGVRPHRGRGLLLPPGGDRTWQENQTADLGHRRPGEVQVAEEKEKTLLFTPQISVNVKDIWYFMLFYLC